MQSPFISQGKTLSGSNTRRIWFLTAPFCLYNNTDVQAVTVDFAVCSLSVQSIAKIVQTHYTETNRNTHLTLLNRLSLTTENLTLLRNDMVYT